MQHLLKSGLVAALIAVELIGQTAGAQGYYRTLDGSSGCVIDIGKINPPNSAYAYSYRLENQCTDRAFNIYYEVNGNSRGPTVLSRGGSWEYPVLKGETFQITAVGEA